jgi:hypothetical protein
MGTSPDEDLISYVHVAHGLEVSSQTNNHLGARFLPTVAKAKVGKACREETAS